MSDYNGGSSGGINTITAGNGLFTTYNANVQYGYMDPSFTPNYCAPVSDDGTMGHIEMLPNGTLFPHSFSYYGKEYVMQQDLVKTNKVRSDLCSNHLWREVY